VSRTAEISFALACLAVVGGDLLIASANGLTGAEIIFAAILGVCVFGLFALVDGAQLRSRGDRSPRRRRGILARVLRRGDAQVVAEAPADKARVSHHPDQLAL
jgi:hypothetical protein